VKRISGTGELCSLEWKTEGVLDYLDNGNKK